MSRSISSSAAAVLMFLLVGGCVTDTPAVPNDLVAEATAPESAEKGETVALTARLQDETWATSVTYRWFQTYGRAVELVGANTAGASFVVPSLPTDQTLRFRVDVSSPAGTIFSDSVGVLVLSDPDYDFTGGGSGDGSGGGGDVTEEQALEQGQAELDKTDDQRAREFADLVVNGEDAAGNRLRTTASGLQYVVITRGSGDPPGRNDTVRVHYSGWVFDTGTKFDSSIERGTTSTFALTNVIAGWTEGLQLMPVGSYYRLVIPSDLAYGEAGNPPQIPGGATLVFDVYLFEVVK